MGIKQHIQIGIFQKRNSYLSETYTVIQLRRISLVLRSTQYLKQNYLVNIPLIHKTGKSKGFALIVTPEKVHQDLLKLDGIDLLGRKILIKEAISTRKKDTKQNKRPIFVVSNFPENRDLFK